VECIDDAHCGAGQLCGSDGLCNNPLSCGSGARCVEDQACLQGQCASTACIDDDLEDNDVPYSASKISSGLLENRVLCPNSWDWYLSDAKPGDGVRVELLYARGSAPPVDPSFLVWTGTGEAPALAGQSSLTPQGQKVEIPSMVREGPIWIGVQGVNQELAYALDLRVSSGGLCDDDLFEPNDNAGLASKLPDPLGGQSKASAVACFADEDWYVMTLPAGLRLSAVADPSDGSPAGNLVLSLFVQSAGGSLTLIGGSGSNRAEAAAAPAERLVLLRLSRVTPGRTSYDLTASLRPPRPLNDACAGAVLLSPSALVQGTTAGASNDGASACGGQSGSDVVYKFSLSAPQQVTFSTTGALDTVLALQSTCGDPLRELVCHDQPGSVEQLSAVLPAGDYTLWVDSFSGAEGAFELSYQAAAPPPAPSNEACASGLILDEAAGGGMESGDLAMAADDLSALCGLGGGDAVYLLNLTQAASLSAELVGAEGLSLSLRSSCLDPLSELACVASAASMGAHLDRPYLSAGSYALVVDGGGPARGAFSLAWALASPIPPPSNEDCQSPEPLVFSAGVAQVSGDTRNARDDLQSSCALQPGATGNGGDVVYSFALLSAQSLQATLTPDFPATLELRALPCDGAQAPLACAAQQNPSLFEPSLAPGIYTLVVDGYAGAVGSFALTVTTAAPLSPPAGDLCSAPVPLDVQGGPVSDSSSNYLGSNSLDPGTLCTPFSQPGNEIVYQVALLAGQTLSATATPSAGFDLSLYLLSSCDPASCVLGADASFTSQPESLIYTAAVDETIYIVVDAWSPQAQGFFTLDLALQ